MKKILYTTEGDACTIETIDGGGVRFVLKRQDGLESFVRFEFKAAGTAVLAAMLLSHMTKAASNALNRLGNFKP